MVDSPLPLGNAAFGWGITSGDFTGDGSPDLVVAQSDNGDAGHIFLYDGATGAHLDTIEPPELNPNASQPPTLAFVYVETMADIGSCPAGDSAGDADALCDDAVIGPRDGRPEIVAGSRNLQVDPASSADADRDAADPRIGRAYIFDGATRAVLKRIDMPASQRAAQQTAGASPQFGRSVVNPRGIPACAGSAGEGNNLGVAPCPTPATEGATDAVRIGDLDGGGEPDLVITARNYQETTGAGGTAAPGSQCAAVSSPPRCTAGRAWIYRGEEIVGTSPSAVLSEAFRSIRNPEAQTQSAEFGGNVLRIGDVGRCNTVDANGLRCTSIGGQDGNPDFVVAARNMDYPFKNPDAAFDNVGAAFLYDGATGALLGTYIHPEIQPRSQFSGGFNAGTPVGDLGATALPDVVLGAPLQNATTVDDGRAYVLRGDAASPGGGAQGSWQFSQFDDPTPQIGENFGASLAGVGDLVPGPENPANELLVGGEGPFDPSTQASNSIISDVHIVNGTYGRTLQTITDPDANPGSGFGIGITPMGDLNGDGFLDFAVSAYLSDAPPSGQPGQGRAFIFRSDDSPAPASPVQPAEPAAPAAPPLAVEQPRELRAGRCENEWLGSEQDDHVRGSIAGDRIFGFGGRDLLQGLQDADCLDGGDGDDTAEGGNGNDLLIGGGGNDLVHGEDGRDRLKGDGGRDRLTGGYGNDVLGGGPGPDDLNGGPGRDRIFGEGGNDRIVDRIGGASIDAGRGNDRVSIRNRRRDTVRCGTGSDRVTADRFDRIGSSCERVLYPRRRRR